MSYGRLEMAYCPSLWHIGMGCFFYSSFLRSLASCSPDAPSPVSGSDSRVAESLKRYLDAPIISHMICSSNPPTPKKSRKTQQK